MTHPQLTSAQIAFGGLGADFFTDRSWGFGMAVTTEGPTAGSFGWDGGLGTSWLVDPARDLTLIVMTQRMFADSRTPAVHTELQEAARAAIA